MESRSINRQQIIDRFGALGIVLHPAGQWKLRHINEELSKKEPIVAHRVDYLHIEDYPNDNMFKFKLEDYNLLCIDIDELSPQEMMEWYQKLPSIKHTLTTTTTGVGKHHIYVKRPENFPITRSIGKNNVAHKGIDLLSNGIIFEGHCYDDNPHYDIENTTIVELTQQEVDLLLLLLPKGIKSNVNSSIKYNRRSDPEELGLIEDYLADNLTNPSRLWHKLDVKEDGKPRSGRPTSKPPELSYSRFNTMAYWLAINQFIPHEKVIAFLEKVIVKEYKLDLNSAQTQARFYKQILPTLPVVESNSFEPDFARFVESLPLSKNGQWRLVSTADSSTTTKYIFLDKHTFVPYTPNGVLLLSKEFALKHFPFLTTEDLKFLKDIEITTDPFAPKVKYDIAYGIFTLSTIKPTEYIVNTVESSAKPDNILTKAIHYIFKQNDENYMLDRSIDPEDFYYHWLAHAIFSDQQMSTVMCLATPGSEQGGTGKTTLTTQIPQKILPAMSALTINDKTTNYDDAFHNTRLACIDDLNDNKNWSQLYTTIKSVTSGTRRLSNLKGKSQEIADSGPSISVSANFYPRVDETDRRFFIWSPTEKLSQAEGKMIGDIIKSKVYRQEIQDLTNYCYYLYNNHKDKYYNELYMEAPATSLFIAAKTEGATGTKFLSLIKAGPEVLFEAFLPQKANQKITKRKIVEIIIGQFSPPTARTQHKWSLQLPQNLLLLMYNAAKPDNDILDWPVRNLRKALDIPKFTTINIKEYKKFYPDWVENGYTLKNIPDETIEAYKRWLAKHPEDNTTEVIIEGLDN